MTAARGQRATRLSGHGLAIRLPAGWEGRIFVRGGARPVMHVATFALLASDGDFGAAATGRMRAGDAFAALIEYRVDERLAPGVGLFAPAGLVLPRPGEFASRQLQVTRPGQLGWQRFFTAGGRPLCLYAVIQPQRGRRRQLVAELRSVLATVELGAGP